MDELLATFLRRDDSLLPVVKAPTRPASVPSAGKTEKTVAIRLLKENVEPADSAPLSGPAVRWARKILQEIIAAHPAPVAKAIPHADRSRPTAEPGTVESVFQRAGRAVPSRGSHSSLAAAFEDERERREVGRYGTPINPPQNATGPPSA